MIGALLRMPWERVVRRMLERLHEHGFDDLDMAHLNVLLYPGPEGARPSELAAQRGMSKQAANYLLGQLEGARIPRAPARRRRPPIEAHRPHRPWRTGRPHDPRRRDLERDWEAQLGHDRFAQLKTLLLELNQPT